MTFKPTFRDNFRQKIASPVKCIEQNRNGDLNAHLTANIKIRSPIEKICFDKTLTQFIN